MSKDLQRALNHLEGILTRAGAVIVSSFHPGRRPDELRDALSTIGLTPSTDVSTFFSWHDGAGERGVPSEVIMLVPGGEFYDVDTLLDQYRTTRRSVLELAQRSEFPFSADEMWDPSWFPILRLFGKGFLAADVSNPPREASPLHLIWHDDDPELAARVAWPTITAFVEAVIGRFETGVYSVDDGGIVRGPTIDFPG